MRLMTESERIRPHRVKQIMAQVGTILLELGEISGENIFIDGTKIESVANKYTFVWKKAVSKNMIKLTEKICVFCAECEELYAYLCIGIIK